MHPLNRFLATVAAATAFCLPHSKPITAQDALSVSAREWEPVLELQLKFNLIEGLEARNKAGSYVMKEGKLVPAGADADLKGIRRFGRKWTHEYLRTFGTQRVSQEMYVCVLSGHPDGWGKEKSEGDAMRVQNLCAALLERDSFGLYSPQPGKKFKWSKIAGQRAVEFNFEGPWLHSKGSNDEVQFFSHGWALDFPGDDLLVLFYGPDSKEVPYEKSLKAIRKMVGKIKPMSERDLEKHMEAQLDMARGKMKKRKWSTPFRTVGMHTWKATEDYPKDVVEAMDQGLAWLLKNQVDGIWSLGKSKAPHEIGVASLAGRAMMGVNAISPNPNVEPALQKTAEWVMKQQQKDGMFGQPKGNSAVYNHAIATAFLLDWYTAQGMPEGELRANLQKALDFIESTQDDGGSWNYDLKQSDNRKVDPSTTYWNILALIRGMECGLKVNEDLIVEARDALLSMAGANGKVGYFEPGGDVARTASAGKKFPWPKSESLTGVGLYCTLLVDTLMLTASEPSAFQWNATRRCLGSPPGMDPEALDLYYWQVASCGMTLMGGAEAREWRESLNDALLEWRIDDHKDPNFGAWTKETAWGEEGGYALTTSLAILSLLNANASTSATRWPDVNQSDE